MPSCCRFGPAVAASPRRPPRLPFEARPAWHFYPFPLPLPPDVYRAPPLSEVLAIPGPVLFLQSDGTVMSELMITEGTAGFTGTLAVEDRFGSALASLS